MSPYGAAHKRDEFESWAMKQGLSVGRDEGGYYDDDVVGKIAWQTWCAAIDAARPRPPTRFRRTWLGKLVLQEQVEVISGGDFSGYAFSDLVWRDVKA